MSPALICVEPVDAEAFSPYGVMLGKHPHQRADGPAYFGPSTDFWREHLFDNGTEGDTEILWVRQRDRDQCLRGLEAFHLTELAVVPLTGPIIQVVANARLDGTPEPRSIRAFLVSPGEGVCLHPDTWHATRVLQEEVTVMMLTRPSSTYDLAVHLRTGAPAAQRSLSILEGYRVQLAPLATGAAGHCEPARRTRSR